MAALLRTMRSEQLAMRNEQFKVKGKVLSPVILSEAKNLALCF